MQADLGLFLVADTGLVPVADAARLGGVELDVQLKLPVTGGLHVSIGPFLLSSDFSHGAAKLGDCSFGPNKESSTNVGEAL